MAVRLGQLVGDVAAADNDRVPGGGDTFPNGRRVIPVLEVVDALHVGVRAGHRQRVRSPARGHQQQIVGERLATGRGGHPGLGVDLLDLRLAQQRDSALGMLLWGAEKDLLAFGFVA